ncbi:hypothetical protein [Flavobacterium sp. 14A]|uniref:hypothetical protein n=1 Tax=Flavobacterium sp. 14A TaxID=2735896 RepID=UPI0015701FE8|nr:hypothetical protein [Flavobacterium sp. 14A]NRT11540.1 glucan phosphoethanolaminetransferase (alkaline phosphatase superfamily) [Flavobacterium sp. 14A]
MTQLKLNRQLAVNTFTAILIAIVPLLAYCYLCFPAVKSWETFAFTYTSTYYENISIFVWVLAQKFIPLYLCLIWLFTSRQWWIKVLMIPIGMYVFQIIILFDDDFALKEEGKLDHWVVFFITAIVSALVLFARQKLAYHVEVLDLKSKVDLELKKICKDDQ